MNTEQLKVLKEQGKKVDAGFLFSFDLLGPYPSYHQQLYEVLENGSVLKKTKENETMTIITSPYLLHTGVYEFVFHIDNLTHGLMGEYEIGIITTKLHLNMCWLREQDPHSAFFLSEKDLDTGDVVKLVLDVDNLELEFFVNGQSSKSFKQLPKQEFFLLSFATRTIGQQISVMSNEWARTKAQLYSRWRRNLYALRNSYCDIVVTI